jgi:pSer/pThr/pTyr-binding forkhead associated (FHA) protein
MGLQQFERRLERLVEGAFAKAFRSGLQPVEIGRRMTREMDQQRTVAPRGTLTPNHFTVALSTEDRTKFEPIEAELISELISVARDHAKAEGYVFIGAVAVEMTTDGDLSPGIVLVGGEMRAAEGAPAQLVQRDGSRHTLGATPLTIGRLPECEIVLGDVNASRRHAEVRQVTDGGGGYVVVDLGSTNGTKVNGVPIHTHRLQHGDEITIGSTHLRFEAQ